MSPQENWRQSGRRDNQAAWATPRQAAGTLRTLPGSGDQAAGTLRGLARLPQRGNFHLSKSDITQNFDQSLSDVTRRIPYKVVAID